MIAGATIQISLDDTSQIAEARRVARKRAEQLGFDETCVEQVAIVTTEAATNVLKHAGRGEILINGAIANQADSRPSLEMLALDKGRGIENVNRCLHDGYSTGSTPGHGLGAIFRLSTYADIYSVGGKGTALVARWASTRDHAGTDHAPLTMGVMNVCKPGQTVCGDSWGSVHGAGYTTVLVADGLGHGYDASVASLAAVRVLLDNPQADPKSLLELVHLALRSSRGAAVAVARIDRTRGKLTFSGAGNISAQLYSGSQPRCHLVSVNGTAGHQTQQLKEFSYPWPQNGVLVMHSDGLQSAAGIDAHPGLVLRDPSLIAGLLYRDYARGNDDATVAVIKEA